jgi:hypothetical protein
MTSIKQLGTFVVGSLLMFVACGGEADPSKPQIAPTGSATSAASAASSAPKTGASASASASASSTAAAPATSGSASAIAALAADCKTPRVLVTTQPVDPKAAPTDYWVFTRQAMLAAPDFKVVTKAAKPGEVTFKAVDLGSDKKSKALVAECADAATCNKLASTLKKLVPSSSPQTSCGEPANTSAPAAAEIQTKGVLGDLPKTGDTRALCARLSACTLAGDSPTSGDPGVECQASPAKFKTACATKLSCDEVVKCTK